jgi:hypothetical protein
MMVKEIIINPNERGNVTRKEKYTLIAGSNISRTT